MAKIPETFELGNRQEKSIDELYNLLIDIYRQLAIAINSKPDLYQRETDGQNTDTFLSNGDININTTTQKVEMLVDRTAVAVTWKTL